MKDSLREPKWIEILKEAGVQPVDSILPQTGLPCSCGETSVTLYQIPGLGLWTYCTSCQAGRDMLVWAADLTARPLRHWFNRVKGEILEYETLPKLQQWVQKQARAEEVWRLAVQQARNSEKTADGRLARICAIPVNTIHKTTCIGMIHLDQCADLIAPAQLEEIRARIPETRVRDPLWMLRYEGVAGCTTGFGLMGVFGSLQRLTTKWWHVPLHSKLVGTPLLWNPQEPEVLDTCAHVFLVPRPMAAVMWQLTHLLHHDQPLPLAITPRAGGRITLPVPLVARTPIVVGDRRDVCIREALRLNAHVTAKAIGAHKSRMEEFVRTPPPYASVLLNSRHWSTAFAHSFGRYGSVAIAKAATHFQLSHLQLEQIYRKLSTGNKRVRRVVHKLLQKTKPVRQFIAGRRTYLATDDGFMMADKRALVSDITGVITEQFTYDNTSTGYRGYFQLNGTRHEFAADASIATNTYMWVQSWLQQNGLPHCWVAEEFQPILWQLLCGNSDMRNNRTQVQIGWQHARNELYLPTGVMRRDGTWLPHDTIPGNWPGNSIIDNSVRTPELLEQLTETNVNMRIFWTAGIYTMLRLLAGAHMQHVHRLVVASNSRVSVRTWKNSLESWGALPPTRDPDHHDWPRVLDGPVIRGGDNMVIIRPWYEAYAYALANPCYLAHAHPPAGKKPLKPMPDGSQLLVPCMQHILNHAPPTRPTLYKDVMSRAIRDWLAQQIGVESVRYPTSASLHAPAERRARLCSLMLRLQRKIVTQGFWPLIDEGTKLTTEAAVVKMRDGTYLVPRCVLPPTLLQKCVNRVDSKAIENRLALSGELLAKTKYGHMPAWQLPGLIQQGS